MKTLLVIALITVALSAGAQIAQTNLVYIDPSNNLVQVSSTPTTEEISWFWAGWSLMLLWVGGFGWVLRIVRGSVSHSA